MKNIGNPETVIDVSVNDGFCEPWTPCPDDDVCPCDVPVEASDVRPVWPHEIGAPE